MTADATMPAMTVPLHKAWTQEEFFAWAEDQDTRYEFDGFRPVAMTGGFIDAAAIGVNLSTALRTRLRGSGCRVLGPDAGLETINRAVRYPDALIARTAFDGRARTVPDVVVVCEVVGATAGSSMRDRITKVREYAAVPSIRRYVILGSSTMGLTVMERSAPDQIWQTTVLTGDDILRIPETGIEIPVAEFYEDVTFPDQDEAAG